MTTKLRADLVQLNARQWRLIGHDGVCCTLEGPPERWLRGAPMEDLDAVLEQMLDDRRQMKPSRLLGCVLLIGGGQLAAETALALAQSGVNVQISAPEVAQTPLDPLGSFTSAAAAMCAWVYSRCPDAQLQIGPHWTAVQPHSVDLIIVATATIQPDRAITDHLSRHWLPHLVVRAHHDCATIGPLVDHQGGPCLACLDLTMADHDELWPATLAALTGRPAQPEPMTARWAGVQTALEASWFLQGAGTTLRASTVEIDSSHTGVARRRWESHPDCSCSTGASGAVLARAA